MEASALVYLGLFALTIAFGLLVDNQAFVSAHIAGGRKRGVFVPLSRTKARNYVAEFAIYALLAGVSACRIAVGNDYWVYRDNFKLIYQSRIVASEFGFNAIVYGMQKLFGYDNYLPIFALFSFVTVFFFVKALHDQAENYVFSLFLLLAGGYYFQSLNSVRYYLALAMALFAAKYVLRGEYLKFILWILAGAMFHKSILLVIPVYLVAILLAKATLKVYHYALLGAAGLSVICFGKNLLRWIIFKIYPYYENSAFDNGSLSYANIAKTLAVLILCLLCYQKSLREDVMNRFYFFLQLCALMVFCCGSFMPESSRIGYYMSASQIFLLPRLIGGMENKKFRWFCTVGVVGCFLVFFFLLLQNMYETDIRLLPYLNWIFN